MSERLFLYIDILGFSNISSEMHRVDKLFKIIDNLHVFHETDDFSCIVFSDTILVYTNYAFSDDPNPSSTIMLMCETAKCLLYGLGKLDIYFRGILSVGEFYRKQLDNIDSYYGSALIRAHNDEKGLMCMGLFIDNKLSPISNVFFTTPYSDDYDYVYLMQTLDHLSCPLGDDRINFGFPLPGEIIQECDITNLLAYDFIYLINIYTHMTDSSLDPRIRAKYLGTWQMLRGRHADLLDSFEKGGLDPSSICDLDWTDYMLRAESPDGFYG
jgi:hypothetical protein